MKRFWFKLTRIDKVGNILKKADYCYIDAKTYNDAYTSLCDTLWYKKSIFCNYFTEHKSYPRSIQDIANIESISEKQVMKFIDRCFYMKAKRK